MKDREVSSSSYGCERLLALSDGIFAIAITLSVLEIVPPDLNERIWREGAGVVLHSMTSKILSVIFSFILVGIYWIAHHRIFEHIRRTDYNFLRINMILLMLVAFMTFAAKFPFTSGEDFTAACIYPSYMAGTGLLLHLLWRYATKNFRLISQDLSQEVIRANLLRAAIPPIIFGLSIPVAFWNVGLARYIWLLLFFSRRINSVVLKLGERFNKKTNLEPALSND